jgi:hypothetical protein
MYRENLALPVRYCHLSRTRYPVREHKLSIWDRIRMRTKTLIGLHRKGRKEGRKGRQEGKERRKERK